MASAQDARALATDKQEHVFIYLFILEYGATGRGQGTHATLPVALPDSTTPSVHAPSLQEGNRPGRGRDRAASGRTPSCHRSSDESSPENAKPESPPGPERRSLHAVPGRGMSGLLWNTPTSAATTQQYAVLGSSLIWGQGQAGPSLDSSPEDPGLLQELQAQEPRTPRGMLLPTC